MNDRPTSEVLNLAADLIEERGWAIGNCGMAVTGPTCLEGAITATIGDCDINVAGTPFVTSDPPLGTPVYAYSGELREHPAYRAVVQHLAYADDLYVWNDHRDRTAAEVVEVLRATALIESARERQAAEVHA